MFGSSNLLCVFKTKDSIISPASSLPNVWWQFSTLPKTNTVRAVCTLGKEKFHTLSDNYLMLDEPGMFSFPSTRPTTPGQSSGPSYGPVQVLMDDTQHPRPASGRTPSRGASRSHTPNADLLDLSDLPNQGFPEDSVCALTRFRVTDWRNTPVQMSEWSLSLIFVPEDQF